ncbi:hypothetical protein ACFLSQ_03395 [Bacteroidota bacterium]
MKNKYWILNLLRIILVVLFLCQHIAYSQENKKIDKLHEKQKDLENHFLDINKIYQNLQGVQFSGSYHDKYVAIKNASAFYKDEASKILPDLDSTHSNYDNFKKGKDELVNLEKKLFILQIAIKSNEAEFYELLKSWRTANDELEPLEFKIYPLLKNAIEKFINYTEIRIQTIKNEIAAIEETIEVNKQIVSLKDMSKVNIIEKIGKLYHYILNKKEFSLISASLIKKADSVLSVLADNIISNYDNIEFFEFFIEFTKLKEKYHSDQNVSLLSSIAFIEVRLAYYCDNKFRNQIKSSISLKNCAPVIYLDAVNSDKNINFDGGFYFRTKPISNEEINLFMISNKESKMFDFETCTDNQLKKTILHYFSQWCGFEIISQEEKTYISELLNHTQTPTTFKTDFKNSLNIKSGQDIIKYISDNEFLKVKTTDFESADQEKAQEKLLEY